MANQLENTVFQYDATKDGRRDISSVWFYNGVPVKDGKNSVSKEQWKTIQASDRYKSAMKKDKSIFKIVEETKAKQQANETAVKAKKKAEE